MTLVSALPDDPALTQLPRDIDEGAMASAFGELLQPHGMCVEQCRLERIKYRPRRNCSLSYRLQLRRNDSGAVFEQRVAARLCSGDDSARRYAKAAPSGWTASPAGPSLCTLPALDMLAWWWPNDPQLKAPALLADARALHAQVLPEVLKVLGGGELRGHELAVVQYVPEQRLTARVALRWSEGGSEHRQTVYAKSSPPPGGAAAHAALRTLQASDAWRAGRLCTPAALLWQPASGLHWQTGLAGDALLERPAAERTALAGALGAQLAALHDTPVTGTPEPGLDALRHQLADVITVLGTALPGEAAALDRLGTRLGHGLRWLAGAPLATLHGDLHPRNVLADGDRLALIDLDDLHRGAAVLELGAWVAEGMARALLDGARPSRDANAWQALLEGYAQAGGVLPSRAALAWATAWNLLTQRTWRCVVNLKPGRFALAPGLIALATRLADAPDLALA